MRTGVRLRIRTHEIKNIAVARLGEYSSLGQWERVKGEG